MRRDVDGVVGAVALALHHRDHHAAHRRGVGHRRAGDAAEQRDWPARWPGPSPPRTWPTRLRAKFMILSAMPPCSISSPEKMKNGIARNENTFIPETIICIGGGERQALDDEGRPGSSGRSRTPPARPAAARDEARSRGRSVPCGSGRARRRRQELRRSRCSIENSAISDAGDDQRQVAQRLGDAQRRDRVVVRRRAPSRTLPYKQQHARTASVDSVDDRAHPALHAACGSSVTSESRPMWPASRTPAAAPNIATEITSSSATCST